MVEFECLETKTLKFCQDSEYPAGMSKEPKHQNKREAKNLQKLQDTLTSEIINIKKIYCSSGNKKTLNDEFYS